MTDLIPTITTLRKELSIIIETHDAELSGFSETLSGTTDYQTYFEQLWCGGWARTDYNVYVNPNNQNQNLQVTAGFFYEYILKKNGTDIEAIGNRIFQLVNIFKKFQKHVVTELSIIRDEEKFGNEIALLEKIEQFKWGFEAADYAKLRRPAQMPVYDMSVLSRGIDVPPHIQAWAYITSLQTKAVSPRNFCDMVTQLLRQIELKSPKNYGSRTDFTEKILGDIFENFHSFCRQLRNRHDSRPEFEVNDEYDVQDLLHAILKLHFKDVREEEYTPSYAGSSSRVDFLLKNEQVVIEVKKTRQGLADKHIGEQLILDVAHYRNHPDCKGLICFVYDPDNRVKNPRGLESDLRRLSDDQMPVELFVRP